MRIRPTQSSLGAARNIRPSETTYISLVPWPFGGNTQTGVGARVRSNFVSKEISANEQSREHLHLAGTHNTKVRAPTTIYDSCKTAGEISPLGDHR